MEIDSMGSLEDAARVLQVYMGVKAAKELAEGLFKEAKKENRVASPIDAFETKLRRLDLSSRAVLEIRYLIDKGKKLAVRNRLLEELGLKGG